VNADKAAWQGPAGRWKLVSGIINTNKKPGRIKAALPSYRQCQADGAQVAPATVPARAQNGLTCSLRKPCRLYLAKFHRWISPAAPGGKVYPTPTAVVPKDRPEPDQPASTIKRIRSNRPEYHREYAAGHSRNHAGGYCKQKTKAPGPVPVRTTEASRPAVWSGKDRCWNTSQNSAENENRKGGKCAELPVGVDYWGALPEPCRFTVVRRTAERGG